MGLKSLRRSISGGFDSMGIKSDVAFKGKKDGILIYLNMNAEYAHLKEQLIRKLESAHLFFNGAKVVGIRGKELNKEQKDEISQIIHSKFGMILAEKPEEEIQVRNKKEIFNGINEGNTKFIRTTMRSGQNINYNGNIVIIGDVNPGAEIIAKGNIMVMGTLRGLAHAGADGNTKAMIVAFRLQSKQLRIANVIGRAPDGEQEGPHIPELAIIKDGALVIEPYLHNK
mgnify:CR=1 FL=1